MINGTIKGKIIGRREFEKVVERSGYCARIDIEVEGWTAGEKTRQAYAVYFPEFMRRRMDYFMKDSVKYCTIVFEAITIVPAVKDGNEAYIVLIANRIEA